MDQPVAEVPQVTQEILAAKAKLKAKRQANRIRQAERKAERQAHCTRQAKRKPYRKGSGAQPNSSVMNSNALDVTQAAKKQRRRLLNRKRNRRRWAKHKAANEPPKAQPAAVPSPKRSAPQTRRAH